MLTMTWHELVKALESSGAVAATPTELESHEHVGIYFRVNAETLWLITTALGLLDIEDVQALAEELITHGAVAYENDLFHISQSAYLPSS